MMTDQTPNFQNQKHAWSILPYRGKLLKLSRPLQIVQLFADRQVDLLTGSVQAFDAASEWKDFIDHFQQAPGIKLMHFFYEFSGLIQRNLSLKDSAGEAYELGVFIRFEQYELDAQSSLNSQNSLDASLNSQVMIEEDDLRLVSSPSFLDYAKKFREAYHNLEQGNCYQLNLTGRFHFESRQLQKVDPFVLATSLWSQSAGAYAHATYLPSLNRLLLSNSPECLFQCETSTSPGGKVVSTPIKGTLPLQSEEDVKAVWEELSSCSKNQSELDMITDLLRNDLSRIEFPRAVVEKRKAPLLVKNILHQYSKVSVELEQTPKLSRLLSCLFPGGSITGAPKQRVGELIERIENEPRGVYCGSTYLSFQDFQAASINIRTADVDLALGRLVYGAGGGITLRSEVRDEYNEMLLKVRSFIDLIAAKNKLEVCSESQNQASLQSF